MRDVLRAADKAIGRPASKRFSPLRRVCRHLEGIATGPYYTLCVRIVCTPLTCTTFFIQSEPNYNNNDGVRLKYDIANTDFRNFLAGTTIYTLYTIRRPPVVSRLGVRYNFPEKISKFVLARKCPTFLETTSYRGPVYLTYF